MKHRGLTIGLAVLLAVLGTAGVLVYVNHANARALAGQKAVTVLVAKGLISSGTSAADAQRQGLLGIETLPAASVPANALTVVTPDISALVTDSDIRPGQLLLRPMLVTPAQVTSGLAIPTGMVAVSVTFCIPEAVAGYLRPGSQVAVFNTSVSGKSGLTAQSGCSGQHQQQPGVSATTKLVLQRATVLAIGQASASTQSGGTSFNGGGSGGSQQNTSLVTLAVSQQDAQQLIRLAEDGLPYLALVNANSSLSASTTGVSAPGR